MPEMVALADRIVVMDRYRVKGVVENNGVYADMSEGIMGLIHDAERETALSRQA
ncbi:hypothetical protein D3C86_2005360 [compost metagenome]|jgi:ribose transport system ATP-binding protein